MRSFSFFSNLLLLLLLPLFATAQPEGVRGDFSMEAENFFVQAAARQEAGALEDAARLYAEAVAASPVHQNAWFNLSLVQYQLSRFQPSEEALSKLLELAPEDTSAYELYGMILYRQGHFDRAIASYNLVLKAGPTDALYVNRALAYLATGRTKPALQDFDEALRLSPANFSACLGKGIALSELGQSQLAISWFNRALELQPGHPEALSNRAIALFQAGEKQQAMDDFRQALSKNKNSSFFIARANCYLAAGNPDDAWYDIQEALHYSPESPAIQELLGEIEWKRGNLPAAIDNFSKVLSADPHHSSCYFKRSKVWMESRQFYEAIADLYRVIDMEPFNREAKSMLLEAYREVDRGNVAVMASSHRG